MAKKLRNRRGERRVEIELAWIAGHEGVEGNEWADEEAKEAARGGGGGEASSREELPVALKGKLPDSISARKQAHAASMKTRWERLWANSPRAHRLAKLNLKAGARSFITLTADLPKRQTSALIFLITRHLPLNAYLHRFKRAEEPFCNHCDDVADETIHHYLFDCPAWGRARHDLIRTLGRNAESLAYLLTNTKATQPLMRYINATGGFKDILGDVCRETYSSY
ncbi:hypothetical protein CONPUDRAFT_70292 [Coniophora puteana RWD-64-598 SS2]|uniref:RNase H type-1 domain-containing protein n=1 Tax=Coniophora puteana (strain RWD-64-598) TaxID=741705 RepID=A0A5M3N291_CONPW|nr:uncharacterized protein CONPUDRAFT_70292 [Coniophora puteana RWD-64-598 SS2]EIW85502.1 hypothetical protein CONPUDRAFT_70292 [Coniophora puteana RWD-64-598 SS2]